LNGIIIDPVYKRIVVVGAVENVDNYPKRLISKNSAC
jgi:hypothetical protein